MDVSRNSMLGELATDAAAERTDFLVQATEQLSKFLDRHRSKVAALGGLTLIDDDPDYLSIAPDGTFRVRSRYEDPTTGEWVSETEVVENASELVELYNPAEIYASFAEAAREAAGHGRPADRGRRAARHGRRAAGGDVRPGRQRGLRGRGRLLGGRAGAGGRRGRRGVGGRRGLQPRARLPGAEPGQRGAAHRPVRGVRLEALGPPGRPDHRGRRGRAPRARRDRPLPGGGPARGQQRAVARAHASPRTSSSSTTPPTCSAISPTRSPRPSRPWRPPKARKRTRRTTAPRARSRSPRPRPTPRPKARRTDSGPSR